MKREVANIGFGFSVENVRFMKPGGRSRCILGTKEHRCVMLFCDRYAKNYSEQRLPECRICNSGYIFGCFGNTRQCVKNILSCRARNTMKKGVLELPNDSVNIREKNDWREKHGSKAKNQNQA